jgi:hypothetical protein
LQELKTLRTIQIMSRTALLIRCDLDEAEKIRAEARNENLAISAYVVRTLNRALSLDDLTLFQELFRKQKGILAEQGGSRMRTALLVRCGTADAQRIREAAKRHNSRLNLFVLQVMKNAGKATFPPHLSDSHAQPQHVKTT